MYCIAHSVLLFMFGSTLVFCVLRVSQNDLPNMETHPDRHGVWTEALLYRWSSWTWGYQLCQNTWHFKGDLHNSYCKDLSSNNYIDYIYSSLSTVYVNVPSVSRKSDWVGLASTLRRLEVWLLRLTAYSMPGWLKIAFWVCNYLICPFKVMRVLWCFF